MELKHELWARRGWLAMATLLGLAIGGAVGLVALHPAYESRAGVVVRQISEDTSQPPEPAGPITMANERELVSADGVVQLVQRRTGWPGSLADLRRPLGVAIVGGTQSMTISYRAGDPGRAQQGAQAFADSYLAYRASRVAAARDGARRNLEAALRATTDGLAGVRASLATTVVGAQAATQLLSEAAAPYQAGLADLNTIDTAAGAVVQPASLPPAPSGPGPLTAAGLGGLLGLVVGASTATAPSRLGRRLRGPGDLEAQLGAPLLATVPRTRRPTPGSGSAWGPGAEDIALVTVAVPDGPAAEAYRRLRARILTVTERFGLKTVMVASPTVEGGAAVIAANLAVSVAATGRRVTLVGADLRSPGLHTYFGMGNDRGLSDVLTGEAAPSDVAQEPPGLDTLRVVPAGPPVAEPAALVEAGPMRVVLEERAEVSDFVVVEAPPEQLLTVERFAIDQLEDDGLPACFHAGTRNEYTSILVDRNPPALYKYSLRCIKSPSPGRTPASPSAARPAIE